MSRVTMDLIKKKRIAGKGAPASPVVDEQAAVEQPAKPAVKKPVKKKAQKRKKAVKKRA